MAKSSRSSVRKSNNSKLKARVFGPKEDERTKRLSKMLTDLASQPKQAPTDSAKEGVQNNENLEEAGEDTNGPEDTTMDVDEEAATEKKPLSRKQEKRTKLEKASRIEKKRVRKVRNTMVFGKKGSSDRKSKRR